MQKNAQFIKTNKPTTEIGWFDSARNYSGENVCSNQN